MNAQPFSDLKFPDIIYILYPSKSELDFLDVINKIKKISEFFEEDIEYSQTLGTLFVRPGILPLLGCKFLSSPLFSWDGDVFKELAAIRFEYNQTKPDWKMTLTVTPDPLSKTTILMDVAYERGEMTYYINSSSGGYKLMKAMGLVDKYHYEEESIIRSYP